MGRANRLQKTAKKQEHDLKRMKSQKFIITLMLTIHSNRVLTSRWVQGHKWPSCNFTGGGAGLSLGIC